MVFGLISAGTAWCDVGRFSQIIIKMFEIVPDNRDDLHPRFGQLDVEKMGMRVRGSTEHVALSAFRVLSGSLICRCVGHTRSETEIEKLPCIRLSMRVPNVIHNMLPTVTGIGC